MDLYSAAKRLNRPFVYTRERRVPAIGEHGAIGDGLTCGLVRPDGVIDWLCMPHFDSPTVFGGLLDPEKGGSTGITPTADHFESLQRYDPHTNVLETLFTVPGQGVVRLVDYMPWSDDPRSSIHEVHRRIECAEGEVELEVFFDPRFDYGRDATEHEIQRYGVLATGHGGDRMVCVLGGQPEWVRRPDGGVSTTLRLRAGQRRWLVLSWDAPQAEPIDAYRPFDHLRTTREAWRSWAHDVDYHGPWRHHVIRSALLLKLLIYAPTGAMVAAPTTSLPEWLGGPRNWDYRYSWSRDTAMAIRAASQLGCLRESTDFFYFVRDSLDPARGLDVMYTIHGGSVPRETTLDHLAGFAGSKPVRIGNGARDQLQLDTAGALLDAAYLHELYDGRLTLGTWRKLCRVVDFIRSRWTEPDEGIWEPRVSRTHNVHSKVMCWTALTRGAHLARLFGARRDHDVWVDEAARIHADVLSNGLDPRGLSFTATYGEDRVDAALLTLPLQGFLPADDPRITATVERVRDELGTGPFVHRYRTHDGVGGAEGAFMLCGFWLAEALAMAGRVDEAQEVFVAHAESSNHLGLLAEEIDPRDGSLLGNFPQAFSHLGLINAARRIDEALQRQDHGDDG